MKLTIEPELKNFLQPELGRLNRSLEQLAKETDGFLGDLLSYVLIGSGKRIRPALVMLSAELGEASPEDVHTVAQAVELVHIATLVHDDVIDKAALRRNQNTVYNEHGVDTAVLLGDHIYTYAFQKVAELGHPQILKLLAESTALMCSGEIEQLKKRFQFNLTEDEYFSFIYKKTASLFGVSARAGAILAGQPAEIQSALEKFGIDLGVAFQITDDLLDLTGEENVVGKTLRTDVMNGKMTLPLIHLRGALATRDQAAAFFADLKHPNGHLANLIVQMDASGSISYAEGKAHERIQRALSHLEALPHGRARELLTSLAEMLLRRKA